ncbi:hypothetical protein PPSIR1_19047 [Plesiocystis pacifica SIR-1]|uniref:RNA polymerase sigma-70 region 2 domain-containing protein n=1 Tax=Plesiocystis pacifica SIR-1 TaxID=391625 RepID=A6GGM6_9BACT|nr:sigma-70 family RNA polymerase sigma factor [Plesiocystis pacifica]EDM74986.1 hypothetical protein PPSIR1_19047 [Plesiocystis pacifica SIR-1]
MSLDDLLRSLRAGEANAEQRLYRELRLELLSYFRRRVSKEDAEDLVQQTLEVIAAELDRFEPQGPRAFRSFAFSVAYNRLRTHRRKVALRRQEREAPGTWVADAEPSVPEVMLWRERRLLLREALGRLRSTYRRAIESRLRDDSPGAVAEAEGIALASLRGRVRKAIEALRGDVRGRRGSGRELSPTPS